ncbi:MAG: hypothetical protein ABWY56_09295 [Propionibacteriaceae bacterium]
MAERGREDPTGGSDPDWLEGGPPPLTPAERRRRRNILAFLVGLVVLVSAVSVVVNRSQHQAAGSDPTPAPVSSSAPVPPTSPTTPGRRGPVVVSDRGAFAPELPDAVLFARSADTVYRVELKTGRVVATPGVGVASSGSAAFIAGRSQVIIRPWDTVPGVVVPDDGLPRELTGLLREGVQALPGPPGQVWVSRDISSDRAARMTLVNLSNGRVTSSVSGGGTFESDGRGGLLLSDVGGVWEASPQRLRRVTTGVVAAVGAHHYLLVNCDSSYQCTSSLFDRDTRKQRTLGPIDTSAVPQGSISPDGKHVALIKTNPQGNAFVDVIRLASGKSVTTEPVSEDSLYAVTNMLVWTPDSHYLFAMRRGELILIDPRTGRTLAPKLPMHDLLQLTWRPAS